MIRVAQSTLTVVTRGKGLREIIVHFMGED